MKKIILTLAFALATPTAFGHGDHAPKVAACAKECSKEQIETALPKAVNLLIEAGKIEGSWASAKIEMVELKKFAKGSDWVVTLLDEKVTDLSKQRRYVFITKKGYLNGSNITGK
jgi:hypothetical protein